MGRREARKEMASSDRKMNEEEKGTSRGTGRDTGLSTKMQAVVRVRDIRNGLIGETTRKIENMGTTTSKGRKEERRGGVCLCSGRDWRKTNRRVRPVV